MMTDHNLFNKELTFGVKETIDTNALNAFFYKYSILPNLEIKILELLEPLNLAINYLIMIRSTILKSENELINKNVFGSCAVMGAYENVAVDEHKLYVYDHIYPKTMVRKPMPFCYDKSCFILNSKNYAKITTKKYCFVDFTSVKSKLSFCGNDLFKRRPDCEKAIKSNETCQFKKTRYMKEFRLFNELYLYCTQDKEGCNFLQYGKVIAKSFISYDKFQNFIPTPTNSILEFFNQQNMWFKTLISVLNIIAGFVVYKIIKWLFIKTKTTMTCNCCKSKETNGVNIENENIRLQPLISESRRQAALNNYDLNP
jgi:hypothetical protein